MHRRTTKSFIWMHYIPWNRLSFVFTVCSALLFSFNALAVEPRDEVLSQLTTDPKGIFCLLVFMSSYLLVITLEKTQLRKSKPVMMGAGIGTHLLLNS